MSLLRSFLVFAGVLVSRTYAYVDFGTLTLPAEPMYEPTPRPNQIPEDFDLRYEILPSMITAVAPSVTLVGNGTRHTEYSLHYHHYFSKTRQGRGVFDKRGVFSGDPPVATCTPCGGAVTSTPPNQSNTSTASCTTHTYHGVFDFPPTTTSAPCYDTNYSGVFEPGTSSSTGLPCCFTIPASCLLNGTSTTSTTTSFTASTGVFRSTSTSTIMSTSASTSSILSTASTSSVFSITLSSTGSTRSSASSVSQSQSQSQGPVLNSGSTLVSSTTSVSSLLPISSALSSSPALPSSSIPPPTTRTTITVIRGTTTVLTLTTSITNGQSPSPSPSPSRSPSQSPSLSPSPSPSPSSSALSSNPYTSPSSETLITTTASYSIIVVSSTTITLTPSTSPVLSTTAGGALTDLPTLTVITGSTTVFTSHSISRSTIIKSNTIIGCGIASGSGIIEGTGTVYLAGTSVSASGTASGYASSVSGCGTIVATTGSFQGVASITGCGFGTGTGTLTGMGTVWPWYAGGLLSFISSGTVTGIGSFRGCGTITGTGTFSATTGSPVIITGTPQPTKTVSVYLSYCPDTAADPPGNIYRLGSDGSDSSNNTQLAAPNLHTNSSSSPNALIPPKNATSLVEIENPLCQICPESVGVCCPPTVSCSAADGKCPLFALENAGNTINGYLIQQVTNSSAPVAGRKKVRALPKGSGGRGTGRTDLVHVEKASGLHKHRDAKRVKHKHF